MPITGFPPTPIGSLGRIASTPNTPHQYNDHNLFASRLDLLSAEIQDHEGNVVYNSGVVSGQDVKGGTGATDPLRLWPTAHANPTGGGIDFYGNVNRPISLASWSGGTATFTTAELHGWAAGNSVTIASVLTTVPDTDPGYNGTYTIVATPTTTTFTVAIASNPGTFVSGGTATRTTGTVVPIGRIKASDGHAVFGKDYTWSGGGAGQFSVRRGTYLPAPLASGTAFIVAGGDDEIPAGANGHGSLVTWYINKRGHTSIENSGAVVSVNSDVTDYNGNINGFASRIWQLATNTHTGFLVFGANITANIGLGSSGSNVDPNVTNHPYINVLEIDANDRAANILPNPGYAERITANGVNDITNQLFLMPSLANAAKFLNAITIPIVNKTAIAADPWSNTTKTITGATFGFGVTYTTSTAHGWVVGDHVTVTGITPSGYNGAVMEITGVGTTTTFTVGIATNPGTYVSGGSAQRAYRMGDYVTQGGLKYMAMFDNTNVTPPNGLIWIEVTNTAPRDNAIWYGVTTSGGTPSTTVNPMFAVTADGDIRASGYMEMYVQTDPGAAPTSPQMSGRLFVRNNAGKLELCMRTSAAVERVWIQP